MLARSSKTSAAAVSRRSPRPAHAKNLRRPSPPCWGARRRFAEAQRALGSFDQEDRRVVGMLANEVRDALQSAVEERRAALRGRRRATVCWRRMRIDVTLPGRRPRPGSLHPLAVVERRDRRGLHPAGLSAWSQGPEIEDDWHNFQALNIPPDHPARTMKDSLYVDVPGTRAAAAHRDLRGADPDDAVAATARLHRRRRGASTAARPPTPRTSRSSTRSRGSRWTRGSRSPT